MSSLPRRKFLHLAGLAGLAALASPVAAPTILPASPRTSRPTTLSAETPVVKPRRLRPGSTIGIAAPAGALKDERHLGEAVDRLRGLGLRVKVAPHVLDRHGYLAGTDADRAADLHALFADPDVEAIFALRGGWGGARLLPLLDYDLIRRNPKILLGYSDITSLLLALYARTGLVTFHGPVGTSPWNAFTVQACRCVLFDGERTRLDAAAETAAPARLRSRVRTITPGRAEGRLVGGNLTVLSALVGTGYLPDWRGHILFLEDTNEPTYRVDRMLTQLRLAGVLDGLAGFVFGKCTGCDAPDDGGLGLDDVLADHLRPLGIPAWSGAMIGHISEHYTLPIGTLAAMDAREGTLEMLEAAVV